MKPTITRTLVIFGILFPSLIVIQTSNSAESRKRRIPMEGESYFMRRVGEDKAKALRETGGTAGSEAAVAAALKWLVEYQMEDGGWQFDHRAGACKGRCPNGGALA